MLAVLQAQLHAYLLTIVERQRVALAGLDDTAVVLAVAVVVGGRILTVPQRAEHVGKAHVLPLEGNEHLVADLGQEICAAILAGHRHRATGPVAFARLALPREFQLYPTKPV